jgi:hypothetical protein
LDKIEKFNNKRAQKQKGEIEDDDDDDGDGDYEVKNSIYNNSKGR